MALPTLSKTWQIVPSLQVGNSVSYALDCGDHFIKLKDTLIGFALNPWTVVSSCAKVGGSTWTAGAVDYWQASNEILWVTSTNPNVSANRSWIVLKQTALGSNFQLLIDCLGQTGSSRNNIYISPSAGFTGGTTLLRPTATDEVRYMDNDFARNGNPFSGAWIGRLHVWMTTDGECTRISLYRGNAQYSFWSIEKPRNPYTGWSQPWVFCLSGSENISGRSVYGVQNTGSWYMSEFGTAIVTAEGAISGSSGTNFQAPDEVLPGAQKAIYPQGLASQTVGWRGARKGQFFDQWWFTGLSDMDTVPDDASRQFVVIGDMLQPWDGSIPLWS